MPVVRVDQQVWNWLKAQARPFEDTPNSVLRRVAGLDPPTESSPATASAARDIQHHPSARERHDTKMGRGSDSLRITGQHLNREFQLGARHALYHKDGTFYERLIRFPGVLCDARGFVRYDSEQQFLSDSRLNIGEKVNLHEALAAHPRYRHFPAVDESIHVGSSEAVKRGD